MLTTPLLQPLQADSHKAQNPLPVGTPGGFRKPGSRQALQTAAQPSDGQQQQQPIDACRITHVAALQLDEFRLLTAEHLLTTKALAVGPDQIQRGINVAEQVPGLSNGNAAGVSQQRDGSLAAISIRLGEPF